jgi:hypothetical protein
LSKTGLRSAFAVAVHPEHTGKVRPVGADDRQRQVLTNPRQGLHVFADRKTHRPLLSVFHRHAHMGDIRLVHEDRCQRESHPNRRTIRVLGAFQTRKEYGEHQSIEHAKPVEQSVAGLLVLQWQHHAHGSEYQVIREQYPRGGGRAFGRFWIVAMFCMLINSATYAP